MKPRIYLDTSVISILHDQRAPDRRAMTADFWSRRSALELLTSTVTADEVNETEDAALRSLMLASLSEVQVHPVTDEARALADRYIAAGAFTGTMREDALHVASATVARCDALLSWNFKHLVNRRRRAAANAVNLAAQMPTIDIISPPEL